MSTESSSDVSQDANHDQTQARIRRLLDQRIEPGQVITEKRIVGGALGFMVDDHLCCAIGKRGLTVRVGPEAKASALGEANVVPHLVGQRETAAFVIVLAEGYQTDVDLGAWIDRGLQFIATLGSASD